MHILLIGKTTFQTGGFEDCKSIAYNTATHLYTITKSDNTTVTYSSDLYYVSILWT